MILSLKNKITAFQRKQKILHNKRYWVFHQKGIRKAKKHHWIGYLDFFTIERNYKLIKLLSTNIK